MSNWDENEDARRKVIAEAMKSSARDRAELEDRFAPPAAKKKPKEKPPEEA